MKDSAWFKGTKTEWQNLPLEEREQLAFEAVGCLYAYPTWDGPVDCMHVYCRIKRGELPNIALTNNILRYEASSGWLRFCSREQRAKVFRAYRKQARATGIYNPWKQPGGAMAFAMLGISSE